MTEDTTKFGVSRRTLAKGAAWSVPAVAVAAAAPAYAASPSFAFTFGASCKQTDNNNCFKHYYVPVTICNKGNAGSLTITSWTISGDTNDTLIVASGGLAEGTTIQFAAGECKTFSVWMKGASTNNLSNGETTFTVGYTYQSAGVTETGTASTYSPTLPPCVQIACTISAQNRILDTQSEEAAVVVDDKPAAEEPAVEEKAAAKEPAVEEPTVEEVKETTQPVTSDANAAAGTAPTTETAGEETANA